MPNLARLAASAEVGLAEVIPPGLPPGSDVGNLAILGYDPTEYHTGRAPIEAAAMGVDLAPDEVAFRCNLVTVDDAGTMVDFAAGHVTSEQSHPIVAALDDVLGDGRDGVRFHPGVEYRHLCVVPRDFGRRRVRAAARPHRAAHRPPRRARPRRSSPRSWTRRSRSSRPPLPRSVRSRPRSGCGARGRVPRCPTSPTASASSGRLVVGRRPRARPRCARRHRGARRARRHRRLRQRLRRAA